MLRELNDQKKKTNQTIYTNKNIINVYEFYLLTRSQLFCILQSINNYVVTLKS